MKLSALGSFKSSRLNSRLSFAGFHKDRLADELAGKMIIMQIWQRRIANNEYRLPRFFISCCFDIV